MSSVDLGKITASVDVGSVTTGAPGSSASVTNSGTTQDAVLNFTIPQGAKGDTVILGNEDDYTLYNTTGQNTDGAMTQQAATNSFPNILSTNKSDLDISDLYGNVIARFYGGNFKVKNFDSSELRLKVIESTHDFEIADLDGNVILRLQGGHIKTKYFDSTDAIGNKTHWYGKKWYAYGTSLTNTSNEGKYATYVEQYSGMIRTNKGISGGALVANRNIYNAIMNTTDGKTDADLITLECLANDGNSPFGTVQDTDNTTFLGSLGQCIAYLQQNTAAQIVIMSSMRGRRNAANTQQFYPYDDEDYTNKCLAMEKLCLMYGVYYINPNHAMGYYRKSDSYYVDNIHHTDLGGHVFADYIWSKLKDIPLWLTS